MSLDILDPVSFLTGIFDAEKGGGKNDPFQLAAGPFLNHELRVLEFHGHEAVNDLYRYEVTFATLEPPELLHAAVFGDPACLTIKAPGHEPRVIQGIVSSLEVLGAVPGERGTKRRRYRLEIVPRLWLLTQRRQNRVFQNKKPQEIIEEVLAGIKIAPEDCNWRIRAEDYPRLPFVYQRDQTDYRFFRQVLADAGIFFCFEHASGLLDTLLPGAGAVAGAVGSVADMFGGPVASTVGEAGSKSKMLTVLNFGDEPSHTPAVRDMALATELAGQGIKSAMSALGVGELNRFIDEDPSEGIPVDDGTGSSADGERIYELGLKKNLRPKAVRMHDRDLLRAQNWVGVAKKAPVKPDTDLGVGLSISMKGPTLEGHSRLDVDIDAPAIPDSILRQELYQLDGTLREYRKKDQRVERELDRLRGDYLVAEGQSDSRRLGAGYRFRAEKHVIRNLNREYTVLSVDSHGVHPDFANESQHIYRNRFRCIPSEYAPRPRRKRAPKLGLEVAKVVAVQGSLVAPYLETNHAGYVRIRFRWDISDDKGTARGSLSYGDEEMHTAWVPVVQPWAGTGYGAQFLPREGMEVLVGFLEHQGNRPVILGCLYNDENGLPFPEAIEHQKVGIKSPTIPENGAYSEISIDSRQNDELIKFHAARDLEEQIVNTRSSIIGFDSMTSVARDTIHGTGGDRSETVAGKFSFSVQGTHTEEVGDSRSDRVENNYELRIGKEFTTEAESLNTMVRGDANLEVRGSRSVVIGEPGLKTVDDRHVYGVASLAADESLHFRADKEIKFTIGVGEGETVLTLTPKGATLTGNSITIHGSDRTIVMGPGPVLTLDKRASLLAKNITIASTGAAIDLGPVATVQGTAVQLKTGAGKAPGFNLGSLPPGTKPFQVRLLDVDGSPIAGKPYHLLYGDQRSEGTTGGDGLVAEAIPEELTHVEVLVWPDDYPEGTRNHFHIHLEEMPPYDTPDGLRARLHALGYDVGVGDENLDEIMPVAVVRFQQDHKDSHQLEVSGKVDQATLDAIKAVFGS